MKKIFLTFLFLFIFLVLNFSTGAVKISAFGACEDLSCEDYVPDYSCINKKILDPTFVCCENKCRGDEGVGEDPLAEQFREMSFFNFRILISEEKVPNLVNAFISTILIAISVYALFRGVYVAGVKRPMATSPDQAASVNKDLRNIIIGFIIAFSFLLILQFVFDFANVEVTDININYEDVDEEGPALVIT